ncbi:hypothetical protein LLG88_13410 [bacterium]|nr:hypothetical protein [bacterium]
MNRRGFLASLVGLAAAALVPWKPSPAPMGLSMRFVRQWDVARVSVVRFDVLFGYSVLQPELACRVLDEERVKDEHFLAGEAWGDD